MTRREHILAAVSDLALSLVFYDRKEDEDLAIGDIEAAIGAGEITAEEIVGAFMGELSNQLETVIGSPVLQAAKPEAGPPMSAAEAIARLQRGK